jgi:SAM-dependent methyltransferase
MNAHQAEITRFWDSRPDTYDQSAYHGLRDPREQQVWLAVLGALLDEQPLDALDAGTGTGFLALLLAELGHRVTGIDLSDGMLAQARRKAAGLANPPRFEIGDAIAPPLPDMSFDVVVCRHLLWTLTDPVGACRNWRRLLRPGGRVVAIEWIHPTPGDWQPYSPEVVAALPLRHLPSPEPIETTMVDAGFSDVRAVRLAEIERIEQEIAPPDGDAPHRYAIVGTRQA